MAKTNAKMPHFCHRVHESLDLFILTCYVPSVEYYAYSTTFIRYL